ncbi:glycoside hydrolase family 2 TIM barrel-domain containing protein [Edaphobacter flagellatus]|uniref:glycoside hydrolase family 2 TIM barrel-domain containing protein n=1 Tax=Edaphobacter flagellatus TaxID=1933044 RepID=UPI0021B2B1AB|nr:glycoside hydrolase family 2 TIM barrel-domain containing protein [Edaphobacter flagellatus]
MNISRRGAIGGLFSGFLSRQLFLPVKLSAADLVLSSHGRPGAPEVLPRMEFCINGRWEISLDDSESRVPSQGWISLRAPARPPIVREQPNKAHWYRCNLVIPPDWAGADRTYFFRIEKLGHYAVLYWNGKRISDHFGQYSPFEADITGHLVPGVANEVVVYVHDASGPYARPGGKISTQKQGRAYRGAVIHESDRNWTGIVGDITLGWRPSTHISNVYVIPSVREGKLEVETSTAGPGRPGAGMMIHTTVLDGDRVVLELPERSASLVAPVRTQADWHRPILWGPEPYGQPKLYSVYTELRSNGLVIDRLLTRFGFREVWIEDRTLFLNGKKLWVSGTYFNKLSALRYLNDSHSQSLMLSIMQQSGLNLLHGHWDCLGTPWLNRCDEQGMLVMAGFFCDGRPDIQSDADSDWEGWMESTCFDWVRTVRNHPSIVIWRPTDVIPENLWDKPGETVAFYSRMAKQVRKLDTSRPLADDTDIQSWAQGSLKDQSVPGIYDDGSYMAEVMASTNKPFLTKEIYTNFSNVCEVSSFLRLFYEKAYRGGGAGVIVQHIPLIDRENKFHLSWLSESGYGNRDAGSDMDQENLPNWCDSRQPIWTPSVYSRLFSELYTQFLRRKPQATEKKQQGEVLFSGLIPNEFVVLMPSKPGRCEPVGLRVSGDGTAWIKDIFPGEYVLHCQRSLVPIVVSITAPVKPGYSAVQHLHVSQDLLCKHSQAHAAIRNR